MDTNSKLGMSLGATKNTPRYIVVHTSDDSYRNCFDQFNKINAYHRDDREFPVSSRGIYVGYHILTTGDKNYLCREDSDVGAHCNQGFDGVTVYPPATPGKLSMNFQSLGICFGGDGDIELPTSKQCELMQTMIWAWQDKYNIPDEHVFFHRKFATNKTCPGSLITQQWLIDLLKRPLPIVLKPSENTCQAQENKIAEQETIISNLRKLVQDLLNWIWKR